MADAEPDGTEKTERESSAPVLFLFGVLLFLGGLVAFLADLVTGHDVVRSVGINAAGALVLVGWAAQDTLSDPDSAVETRGGAAGTALLLYGAYLVLTSMVVAATTIWSGRLELAFLLGGGGLVAVVVGYLVFPSDAVVGRDDQSDDDTHEPGQPDAAEPSDEGP